ncbi:hypothetical protein H4582DRAFT_999249 [Lactarius indigo]|nr:hypothetical protein H4582DRAFT_999249 [Lactarius indigo]
MESFSPNKANLFPILPSTIRYSRYRAMRMRVSPTMVPLGTNLVSVPSYQSQGWTVSAHPEGKCYYAHIKTHAGITLVTEADIAEPGASDQLYAWLAVICNVITEEHVTLPEAAYLFLEIHQDSGTCNYYFARHDLRTIFWLHAIDTINVGLPHSFSSGHLQYALEENYWIHVEMFPDTASLYSFTALNELQIVFLKACADALTSETLTFPYTAKQIEEFIDFLRRSKDHASSPYITTYVARSWATVANYRFLNHFSEEQRRLSSDQSILKVPDNRLGLVLTFISDVLLFGFPNKHQARLESLWMDQLTCTDPWRKHISKTVEDLTPMIPWYLCLISNTLMTRVYIPLSYSPLLLYNLGLIVTSILLREQRGLVDTDATAAAVYLGGRKTTNYGFQPIAIVHCLPKALFVWASLLFSFQCLWHTFTFSRHPPHFLASTLFLIGTVLVRVCARKWATLQLRQRPFQDSTLPALAPPLVPAEGQKEEPKAERIV